MNADESGRHGPGEGTEPPARRRPEETVPATGGTGGEAEGLPEPEPDRRTYYPRGWRVALVALAVMLMWLLVGIFWNPEWWPWFRAD